MSPRPAEALPKGGEHDCEARQEKGGSWYNIIHVPTGKLVAVPKPFYHPQLPAKQAHMATWPIRWPTKAKAVAALAQLREPDQPDLFNREAA